LLLCSPQVAVDQYQALQRALPRVHLHYALKPLPHTWIVQALAEAGSSFDLAANGEVDLVRNCGVAPDRTIHTHPIKRASDIEHALAYGCRTFVVDNPDEIHKLTPYAEQARVLLRLSFRSRDAVVDLSWKFGAQPDQALELLRLGKSLGIHWQGLCFHTGSQNTNTSQYVEAIHVCRRIFDLAALDGILLSTLDIGGGFPVSYTEPVLPIELYAQPIAQELDRLFPDTRLLAEPGRFIAAPACLAVSTVMGRAQRQGQWWYYLDDGMYGTYSGKIFDHADYPITTVRELTEPNCTRYPSVLAGPTCDSIDVPYENLLLPALDVGDLILAPMTGAYTLATATDFNFFPRAKLINLDSEEIA
jgi:ornithine decarboxylase